MTSYTGPLKNVSMTGYQEGMKLPENSSLTLNCVSCGIPIPRIAWEQNGVRRTTGNVTSSSNDSCTTSILHFHNLDNVLDRDSFVCLAGNGFGPDVTAGVKVRLETQGMRVGFARGSDGK